MVCFITEAQFTCSVGELSLRKTAAAIVIVLLQDLEDAGSREE